MYAQTYFTLIQDTQICTVGLTKNLFQIISVDFTNPMSLKANNTDLYTVLLWPWIVKTCGETAASCPFQ